MSDENEHFDRRTVLKGISAGSIGTIALSGAVEAKEAETPPPTDTLEYDHRGQNSAGYSARIITQIFESGDENGSAVAEVRTPVLDDPGSKHQTSLDLEDGKYTVKSRAVFGDGPPATAEKEFEFPKGGIPEYSAIVVSVTGSDSIRIAEIKV